MSLPGARTTLLPMGVATPVTADARRRSPSMLGETVDSGAGPAARSILDVVPGTRVHQFEIIRELAAAAWARCSWPATPSWPGWPR